MTTEKQTPAELAEEIKQFIASEFGITGGTLHSKINQLAALASAAQGEAVAWEWSMDGISWFSASRDWAEKIMAGKGHDSTLRARALCTAPVPAVPAKSLNKDEK